jgi:hypothetical protein
MSNSFRFISPEFQEIVFDKDYSELKSKEGFNPCLHIDTNVLINLKKLTKYMNSNPILDTKYRILLRLIRSENIPLYLLPSLVECTFSFSTYEIDEEKYNQLFENLSNDLAYKLDSSNNFGQVNLFGGLNDAIQFTELRRNQIILVYTSLLKIIQISRLGNSRNLAKRNFDLYCDWIMKKAHVNSAYATHVAINVFFGSQSINKVLKFHSPDAIKAAKNCTFDILHVYDFMEVNWEDFEVNNVWSIFVSQDTNLLELSKTTLFTGNHVTDTNSYDKIGLYFDDLTLSELEINYINEKSLILNDVKRLPDKEIIIESILKEKEDLESSLASI